MKITIFYHHQITDDATAVFWPRLECRICWHPSGAQKLGPPDQVMCGKTSVQGHPFGARIRNHPQEITELFFLANQDF